MSNLLDIDQLSAQDIQQIWQLATANSDQKISGKVAWSFEGNGIRTRTTFLQAFQNLGLDFVELPNFLKTQESAHDLAGYMDAFYDLYVLRDKNHVRMTEFAEASRRPVINAMTDSAHPCEILTDGYFLQQHFADIQKLKVLLIGPVTNVFRSWHALAKVLDLQINHFCPPEYQTPAQHIHFMDQLAGDFDVVVTDAWSADFFDQNYSISPAMLRDIGNPMLLPTPPVSVGKELAVPLSEFDSFAGYQQKALLLPVQKAIVRFMLDQS